MSEWDGGSPQKDGVIPFRGRRKNATQRVMPHVSMSENIEQFEIDMAKLRANNGQTRAGVNFLLDPDAADIESVVVVRRNDNSPAFLEIRTALKPTNKRRATKTFRIIYRADVEASDDPKHNGVGLLRSGIDELSRQGLFIPTNAPALLTAVSLYKNDPTNNLRPALLWCEGEKTRIALQRRVETEEALDAFAQRGLVPVTSATLSGLTGVKHTNYLLAPGPGTAITSTRIGKNNTVLDLNSAIHFIVLDNDSAGYFEGTVLADRFSTEYRVDPAQIYLVEAPPGAPTGWDDADRLPSLVTESERIDQILNAPLFSQRWIYKVKAKGEYEINAEHVGNRRRALKMSGITDCYTDTTVNRPIIRSTQNWQNRESPDDVELLGLAETALKHMGHEPTTTHLNKEKWRDSLNSMVLNASRDIIHEETMQMIERGRERCNEENRPENLFQRSFGLSDTEFNRLAGWHLMRDSLALRLRPAFNAEPVIPQLLFVFYGNENSGKSTAVKVLAGGSPAPVNDAPRYSDNLDLYDLKGSETHGDLQLYHKIAGKTAVELADKSLGTDITRSRADMLKHFANKGAVLFRGMWVATPKTCNLRCIRIFTTNNSDILTSDMGSRRWVIIDTTKTEWPTTEEIKTALIKEAREPTTHESARLMNHNPGLNWLHENLSAMFAHMYDSGDWKHDLHPTPQFMSLMSESQTDYVSEDTWELVMGAEIDRFETEAHDVGVLAAQLARYVHDVFTTRGPSPQAVGAYLRRRKWQSTVHRPKGLKATRAWHLGNGTKISRYAVWSHRDGSSPGRWTIQEHIDASHIETMNDAAKDSPF